MCPTDLVFSNAGDLELLVLSNADEEKTNLEEKNLLEVSLFSFGSNNGFIVLGSHLL